MKITKQTPTTLVLQNNASINFVLVWLSISNVILGIGISSVLWPLFSGELKTLDCKRVELKQVECNLTSVNWLGKVKERTFIPRLQGARVIEKTETRVDKDSDEEYKITYYTLILATLVNRTISDIPASTSSFLDEKDATAARINNFIKDQLQTSLTIRLHDNRPSVTQIIFSPLSVLVVLAVAVNMFLLLFKFPVMWVFDKKSGNLHVMFKNVIRQSETKRFRLRDIKYAEVIESESTDSDGDTTTSYETRLNMRSGNPVHLSSRGDYDIAQAINKFLEISKS